MSGPSKSEIAQVFKRLRSVPANKVCFDCHSKNPTWSSVTYGVFICIDCSGIHRSLGVHLTFVKSTQLDHNWPWQQLRQMQLGGNANATAFFRQHNCDTSDTQLKYKSRAAQLYRDKLHHLAAQAMRLHGTKLFIETPQNSQSGDSVEAEDNDDDFFDKHTDEEASAAAATPVCNSSAVSCGVTSSEKSSVNGSSDDSAAPSVEAALSTSPTAAAQMQATRKPTIGQRKPQAKKGGLGAKKGGGLGAQKVKKDFAEIEREAELADQGRVKAAEDEKVAAAQKVEQDAKAVASMRLAYQDLSVQQKEKEEKLKHVDPKKAKQVERLGMGVSNKPGVSHSMITEISAIEQEEPMSSNTRSSNFGAPKTSFEDDFEFIGGFDRRDNRSSFDDFSSSKSNNNGGGHNVWEKEFEAVKNMSKISSQPESNWSNTFEEDGPKRGATVDRSRRPDTLATSSSSSVEAQQKFGSAKAISSDMYFGDDSNSGPDANLSRFQGSASISSAEYFGREETAPGRGITTPDLDDVKESVRQGVSKVAGRLSNMASGALTQLQDKYGY